MGKAGTKQGIIPPFPTLEMKAGRLICRNKSPKEVPPASGHDSRELNLCISQSFPQPDTAGRLTQLSQQPADVFFVFFFSTSTLVCVRSLEPHQRGCYRWLRPGAAFQAKLGVRQRRGKEVCHRQPASTQPRTQIPAESRGPLPPSSGCPGPTALGAGSGDRKRRRKRGNGPG